MFRRLPDAPAEVDPLFAEIEATAAGLTCFVDVGDDAVADEMRNTLEDIDYEDDEDSAAAHRAAFVDIAALALAGIRAIDGR